MRAFFLIITLALSIPSTAHAGDRKKPSPVKVICKNLEVTGSRVLSNRVCKTKAEWEANETHTQHEALEMQRRGPARDPQGDRGPRAQF